MKKQRFTSGAGLLSVPPNCKAPSRPHSAFTLAEVMVSAAVLGIGLVSLYGGFSSGFAIVRLNRENLRGTQILEEKMDMIRLYNWDQVINQPAINYLPANFTAPFYATNSTDSLASGF